MFLSSGVCASSKVGNVVGMREDERLLLSSSFGAAAPAYAQHRPDYPQAAVSWALEPAPGLRVLDLGAGTGKLTVTLLALGADTDAVLVGNAMHWFDMDMAGPEVARVLRPGGVLAGLWNVFDDRVEWVAGLQQVSGRAAVGPRDTLSSWRARPADAHFPSLGSIAEFDSETLLEFPHGQQRTAESLVATLATKAGVLVMPEQERQAMLGRIGRFLADRPETACGEFTLPMLTGVQRAQRR
jgi:hypothetical protein